MKNRTYEKIMLLLSTATALSSAGSLLWKLKGSKPKTTVIKAGSVKDLIELLRLKQE